MFNFIKVIAAMVCAVFITFLVTFIPLDYFIKRSCDNYQEMTGRKTVYKHFDTCYVQQGEVMIPMREIQVREQEVKVK